MTENKNKIRAKILLLPTVIVLMAVFLLMAFPLVAQETNSNNNINDNVNADPETSVNDNANTNSAVAADAPVGDLTNEINEKKKRIDELNEQSKIYQENLKEKQNEKASLSNEVYILNNQISLTNLDISKKQTEIESLMLSIEEAQGKIDEKVEEINQQKSQIAEFVQIMYKNEQTSYLEIALLNDSFSDFFNQVKYISNVQSQVKKDLDKFVQLKHDLEITKEDLAGKKLELDDSRQTLVSKKSDLSEQIDYQNILLDQTASSESQYAALLDSAKKEALAVRGEVSSLEKRMREKLMLEKGEQYYGEFSGVFIWPVNSRIVSCGFHCSGYPYEKWLGPHPAIDIAVAQGSPVYAAADGYVAVARKLDWIIYSYDEKTCKDPKGCKRSAYNYISIVHNEELSTLYGHLSQVSVGEGDFVTKGQVIGASGGLPGMAGTGLYSTGAHLHFEARKVNENGIPIPVDPAQYLP
ncbi:MAG: peptidoglycan DD-metalloendopeptidase family protein [Patescibacteria group bacterium]